MKCLTLIVHSSAKEEMADYLMNVNDVKGFTVLSGEGYTCAVCSDPFETILDKVTGYVPRVRVDVILEDHAVEKVLSELRGCTTCGQGQGIWWITPVEASGEL